MEQELSKGNLRGSREAWLGAAHAALLETGIDSVRIQPLAKKLGLSRTSFYWFFRDREALLSALVERWRDRNTGSLVRQAEAYAETLAEAMLNVFDCWLDTGLFDAKFEFAIRSWALQSPEISEEVNSADQIRLSALRRMFIRFGVGEGMADVRARTTYLVQIGYISMQADEDLETRMKRIPDYVAIFTGETPLVRQIDRFHARHGYRP